jgi:hypothetical protein
VWGSTPSRGIDVLPVTRCGGVVLYIPPRDSPCCCQLLPFPLLLYSHVVPDTLAMPVILCGYRSIEAVSEGSDNLRPAYINALQLAHISARSNLSLTNLSFPL